MEYQAPEQFSLVVADNGEESGANAVQTLEEAGYHTQRITRDLEGLTQVARIKPQAIVLIGFDDEKEDWALPLVEGNPSAPVLLAIEDPVVLARAPGWLYDVVAPEHMSTALVHRLQRALNYNDLLQLTESRTERLGLSRAQIGMLSMIDVVTGLFNQRYFKKHLRESFAAATRYERPLTCLLFRLDNYWELKEELGRELANDVLDTVARTLTSVIRRADTAARIDEDLFGFLLPETGLEGCKLLANRLLKRLRRTDFPYQAKVLVSSAAVELSARHETPDSLLVEALSQVPQHG